MAFPKPPAWASETPFSEDQSVDQYNRIPQGKFPDLPAWASEQPTNQGPSLKDYGRLALEAGGTAAINVAKIPYHLGALIGQPGAQEALDELNQTQAQGEQLVNPQLMAQAQLVDEQGKFNINPLSVTHAVVTGAPSALPYALAGIEGLPAVAGLGVLGAVGAEQGATEAYQETREKALANHMSVEDAESLARKVSGISAVTGAATALLGGRMAHGLAENVEGRISKAVLGALGFTPAAYTQGFADKAAADLATGQKLDLNEYHKAGIVSAVSNLVAGAPLGLMHTPETAEQRLRRTLGPQAGDITPEQPPAPELTPEQQRAQDEAQANASYEEMRANARQRKVAQASKGLKVEEMNPEEITLSEEANRKRELDSLIAEQEAIDNAPYPRTERAKSVKAHNITLETPYPRTEEAQDITPAEPIGSEADRTEVTPQEEETMARLEDLSKIEFQHENVRKDKPLPKGEVDYAANKYLSQDKNRLKVRTFNDFWNDQSIPESAKAEARKRGFTDPAAFSSGDTIYLNSDHIDSYRELVRQVEHEKTHIGQKVITAAPELYKQYQQIADMRPDAVQKIQSQLKDQGANPYDLTDPDHKAAIGSEILAQIGEKNIKNSLVQKALYHIRNGMRKLGINLKYSDNDLFHKFIKPAKDWLRTGKTNGFDFSRMSRGQLRADVEQANLHSNFFKENLNEYDTAAQEELFRRNRLRGGKDIEFAHQLQDYKDMDSDKLKRVYLDLTRRGIDNEVDKAHKELVNRGINPDDVPRIADLNDLSKIPANTSVEQLDHERFLKEVQDARAERNANDATGNVGYKDMSPEDLTRAYHDTEDQIESALNRDDQESAYHMMASQKEIEDEFRNRGLDVPSRLVQQPGARERPKPRLSSYYGQKVEKGAEASNVPEFQHQIKQRIQQVKDKVNQSEAADTLREMSNFWGKVMTPHQRGKTGETAGQTLQSLLGKSAREQRINEKKLKDAVEKAKVSFTKWSDEDRLDFEHNLLRGLPQKTPELQELSNQLSKPIFALQKQLQELAPENKESFITEFLPGMFKNPRKAADFFSRRMRQETQKGNIHYIPTTKEAFEAGLKPIDTNPVSMLLYRTQEMGRFVVGREFVDDMWKRGYAKSFTAGQIEPEGWVRLDSQFASTLKPKEKGQSGHWYVPQQVQQVVHNYLTPGLRNKLPGFNEYMKFAGALNNAQLGVSAFHATFTTFDVMNGSIALAVQDIADNPLSIKNWMRAGKTLSQAPATALSSYSGKGMGADLLRAYSDPNFLKDTDPERHAQLQAIVKDYERAGGRDREVRWYDDKMWNKFLEAAQRGETGTAAMRAVPGVLNAIASPIMEHLVPRQKILMFSLLRERSLRIAADKGENQDQITRRLQKDLASVDNRLGQLVYDNLHWNRTFKDIAQALTRSVSWNVGTFRELGSGAFDVARFGKDTGLWTMGKGEKPELTPAGSYFISTMIMTTLAGSIIQKVMTGKSPESIKDLVYPRVGGKDLNGYDLRVAVPLYSKDVASYAHDYKMGNIDTLSNKLNPAITMIHDMIQNKDFYGTEIHHKDDQNFIKDKIGWVLDNAEYVGKQFIPFGVRNALFPEQAHVKGITQFSQLAGFPKAPQWVEGTSAYDLSSEILRKNLSATAKTKEEAKRYQLANEIERGLSNPDPKIRDENMKLMQESFQKGDLLQKDIGRIRGKLLTNDPLLYNVKKIHNVDDAMKVWREASPEERRQIWPVMMKKITDAKTFPTPEAKMAYLKEIRDGLRGNE